ncbi:hypothetical protein, partial [Falsiroseomonas oryziterrae]|uniref:hypothetical protein n=1 Tax=Falsiroseomonas oryziterrae TaxID=2911368 RepID=UPI001F3A8EE0
MRLRHLLPGLLLLAAPILALTGAAGPAAAQQGGQDWFIPGQQRPQGAQGQGAQPARPPQGQQPAL